MLFYAFSQKKTGQCIFFLFFFRFRLSFFKIGVMFTVRVFAIRQERSHINFGICCEHEVALLKKRRPKQPPLCGTNGKYDLEFGQIKAEGRLERIIRAPLPPLSYLI